MKSIALIASFLITSCSGVENRNYETQERSYWSGPSPHGIDNTEPYGSITLCVLIDYENMAKLGTENPHGRYPVSAIFQTKEISFGHYLAKFDDGEGNKYKFQLIDDGVKNPVLVIENDVSEKVPDYEYQYLGGTYSLNRGECPY